MSSLDIYISFCHAGHIFVFAWLDASPFFMGYTSSRASGTSPSLRSSILWSKESFVCRTQGMLDTTRISVFQLHCQPKTNDVKTTTMVNKDYPYYQPTEAGYLITKNVAITFESAYYVAQNSYKKNISTPAGHLQDSRTFYLYKFIIYTFLWR